MTRRDIAGYAFPFPVSAGSFFSPGARRFFPRVAVSLLSLCRCVAVRGFKWGFGLVAKKMNAGNPEREGITR